MKIYLVGGAVRDLLLNQPINEYDWVVVGSTPEQMLSNGYQQVGKDFPVFLHPQSKEEYALARTERKSSHGYTGFEVFADASVTLESDLLRRDLTINALALDIEKLCGHYIEHHQHKNPLQHLLSTQNKLSLSDFSSSEIIAAIIDPFDGLNDLNSRKLKHISPAFSEDPLRVIRLARFSARFFHLGFSIVEETAYLAKKMSDSGELDYLVAERVWQETERALMTQTPSQYFEFLYNVRALEKIYPELANTFTEHFKLDANLAYQANHSTLRHIPMAQRFAGLNILAKQNYPNPAKFALLFTALLDRNRKKPEFVQLCQTWKIPNSYRDLAWSIHDRINHWLSLQKIDASLLLNFLTDLNVFKQDETLEVYCAICFAVFHSSDYAEMNQKQKAWLIQAVNIVRDITAQEFINQGKMGAEIKDSLVLARKTALEHYLLT